MSDLPLPGPGLRRHVRRVLRAWFRRHQRDLPWRQRRDPYAIWVSEIMLQQTQVATVVPYFERFLRTFPTVSALAAADEQEVLRLWEGLGYYRRARDLHRGARRLVSEQGGCVPDDPEVLRTLPGIGRYTLGAILSQAFDRRLPILEANSQRVLCRLFSLRVDPREGPARRWLWKAAESLLPVRHVGEFNQALMELGALVCIPAAPRCACCPLASVCGAHQAGLEEDIPLRARPPRPIEVHEAAVVVRRGAEVFLVQRPLTGRWAGLWEFPHGPVQGTESHEEAALRLLGQLTGLRAHLGQELLILKHGVTHHRITMVCFEARYRAGGFRSDFYRQGKWVLPGQLAPYPVSAPQRRLADRLLAPECQKRLF